MHLQQLWQGQVFVLARSGEKYVRMGCLNGHRIQCLRIGDGRVTTLSRQCHVKPVVRAVQVDGQVMGWTLVQLEEVQL